MITVILPAHLRTLARVDGSIELNIEGEKSVQSLLDSLEKKYPMLRGTIRDHTTLKRRPFLRFYACQQDLSLEPPETTLPEAVLSGKEPFLIIGSVAGG